MDRAVLATARILILWVCTLALVGCASLWSRGNRALLRSDLQALLGHEVELRDCEMLGTTRTGYCRFEAVGMDLPGIRSNLGLVEVDLGAPDQEAETWLNERACPSLKEFRVYRSERRANQLKLANGTAFEYMLLFIPDNGGEACVQVSYAYG